MPETTPPGSIPAPGNTPGRLADASTSPVTRDVAHTGVVIVDHGSRRAASNVMLEHFVEQFAAASPYTIVEAAHMELAEPSIRTAFDKCVARGARRVVICPYFLLPGKHWDQDIPMLTRDAASRHPGVPYMITAPIGLDPMMCEVIEHRIDYCLSKAAGQADECESCRGTGRCRFESAG